MKYTRKFWFGVLLLLIGLVWYALPPFGEVPAAYDNLFALIFIIRGGLGAFLALIGIFIVWIEVDEYKMEKELQEFEEEERRREVTESKRSEEAQIRSEVISSKPRETVVKPTVPRAEATPKRKVTTVRAAPKKAKRKGLYCRKCNKDFDTERGYKIHMSRVHG